MSSNTFLSLHFCVGAKLSEWRPMGESWSAQLTVRHADGAQFKAVLFSARPFQIEPPDAVEEPKHEP